jgi:hypothetical protein
VPNFEFMKSSYSSGNGECVEVARNIADAVAVRDAKDADGPTLQLTPGSWTASLRVVSPHR